MFVRDAFSFNFRPAILLLSQKCLTCRPRTQTNRAQQRKFYILFVLFSASGRVVSAVRRNHLFITSFAIIAMAVTRQPVSAFIIVAASNHKISFCRLLDAQLWTRDERKIGTRKRRAERKERKSGDKENGNWIQGNGTIKAHVVSFFVRAHTMTAHDSSLSTTAENGTAEDHSVHSHVSNVNATRCVRSCRISNIAFVRESLPLFAGPRQRSGLASVIKNEMITLLW